jgi:hypothetical protein
MSLAKSTVLLLVAVSTPLASFGWADDPASGFEVEALATPVQPVTTTLSNGEFLVLLATGLDQYAEDGTLLRRITSFPGGAFPEGVVVDPTEVFALAGQCGQGTYRVDLTSGAQTFLSFLTSPSMVFDGPSSVLLSHSSIVASVYRIVRMDLWTGAAETVVTLDGPITGIAMDGAGNLYATHWSQLFVSATWEVLRYSAAQLAMGGLVAADGLPVLQKLDKVHGLAVQPDGSELYLSMASGSILVRRGGKPLQPLLTLAVPSATTLQLLPGAGPAEFLAYQPPGGGELIVGDFGAFGVGRLRVKPARPVASVSGPGLSGTGPFDLMLDGGPPNGLAFIYYGPLGSIANPEVVFQFRVPLFFGLGPATVRRAPGTYMLDGTGSLTAQFVNGTGAPDLWAIQLLLFDQGKLVGSSTRAFL